MAKHTTGSLPIRERRSAVRQNAQCSGDLRDARDDPTPSATDRNTVDVKSNLRLDVGLWASAEFAQR
jgi:hypothetical protein